MPKAKPTAAARRSDAAVGPNAKSFPTPADIRPDVEFVRSLVPPFGDTDVPPTRTFTLPRDADLTGRGRPADTAAPHRTDLDSSGAYRAEVSRSMSVGDATASMPRAREPSPGSGKPPVKVKPPVMKKPARAGEVIKRLQESLAQQGAVSVTAPQ